MIGGRGTPAVQLWETPDALALNFADVTSSDLLSGDTRPQFVGVPVLNLSGAVATDLRAEVVEDDVFEATSLALPALPPGGMTKLTFALRLTAPPGVGDSTRTVHLRVGSADLDARYEATLDLPVVDPAATHRESFRSAVDHSAQYFGLVPPSDFQPDRAYGVVLTLHGAGVEGIGQAQAYSAKDWTYIAAATNRRPFGFDWEEWGRADALEVLDHVQRTFATDATRVYLTGHSMGGHGTWNVGVHNPGRFATLGPSAGWSSFYSYTGDPVPTGPFGRARASSSTNDYLRNLSRRGIYIIHGDADDNVPVREARDMRTNLMGVTDDVVYHEQPGAGHWWDGEASAGADCVDWPPLFEFMQAHTLDPLETDFEFRTPGPWVTPTHSFVTLRSAESADADCVVGAARDGDAITLTTQNVRSLELDGDALSGLGITRVSVDGTEVPVMPGALPVGPQTGKRPGLNGPMNEVYARPFCYVYPDASPGYAAYAAYQLSYWAIIGNGQACALPRSLLTARIEAGYNLIHVGPTRRDCRACRRGRRLGQRRRRPSVGGQTFPRASMAFVYRGGRRRAPAGRAERHRAGASGRSTPSNRSARGAVCRTTCCSAATPGWPPGSSTRRGRCPFGSPGRPGSAICASCAYVEVPFVSDSLRCQRPRWSRPRPRGPRAGVLGAQRRGRRRRGTVPARTRGSEARRAAAPPGDGGPGGEVRAGRPGARPWAAAPGAVSSRAVRTSGGEGGTGGTGGSVGGEGGAPESAAPAAAARWAASRPIGRGARPRCRRRRPRDRRRQLPERGQREPARRRRRRSRATPATRATPISTACPIARICAPCSTCGPWTRTATAWAISATCAPRSPIPRSATRTATARATPARTPATRTRTACACPTTTARRSPIASSSTATETAAATPVTSARTRRTSASSTWMATAMGDACDLCPAVADDGFSHRDGDGDGFAPCAGDCDDSQRDVGPGAGERCNAADDDCDGRTDEDFP